MNNYNLVLHVDKTDNSLNIAFHNFINYAAALTGKTFKVILLVNAAAVTLLKSDNAAISEMLEKAVSLGLEVHACNNALVANKMTKEDLYPQCSVVPAGVVELVELQNQGYAYVKP